MWRKMPLSQRKKSPYSELFWSAFFTDFPAFGLNTERYYLSVFSPNAGKYRPEITPYLDIFHAVVFFIDIWQDPKYRSTHSRMFLKTDVPKNFAIFTGKYLCWSFFLINLLAWKPATLLKRNSNTGVFLWILLNF